MIRLACTEKQIKEVIEMSEKTPEHYEQEFNKYCKQVAKMVVAVAVMAVGCIALYVYTFAWKPQVKHNNERLQEQQHQFKIAQEAEMLVAPPYWTVKRESEVITLSTDKGAFDSDTEPVIPRKALKQLFEDGKFFVTGVGHIAEGRKIKFHYRKDPVFPASDEWDLIEASIVK